jgi:hypothetical protein
MAKLHDFVRFIYNSDYCDNGRYWFFNIISLISDYTIPNKIGNITLKHSWPLIKPPTQ